MLKIGEKIKELRKAQDVTQEKLADYLNISYQAVSKWENGLALPDLSLIPALSNFFGVTSDYLLGIKADENEEKINEYFEKAMNCSHTGEMEKGIEIIREALKTYPNNSKLLSVLIGFLFGSFCVNGKKELLEEIVAKAELVLQDSTNEEERIDVLEKLAYSYNHLEMQDKAIETANRLPDTVVNRQMVLSNIIMPMNKRKEKQQECVFYNFEVMINHILWLGGNSLYRKEFSKAIDIYSRAIVLIENIGNEGFFLLKSAGAHNGLAMAYSSIGDVDQAYENIDKVIECYVKFEDALKCGKYSYKTPVLDMLTFRRDHLHANSTVTEFEDWYAKMGHDYKNYFEAVINDKRFPVLRTRIEKILSIKNSDKTLSKELLLNLNDNCFQKLKDNEEFFALKERLEDSDQAIRFIISDISKLNKFTDSNIKILDWKKDFELINQFYKEGFAIYDLLKDDPDEFESLGTVAYIKDDKIVSLADIMKINENELQIGAVATLPTERNKGYCKAVVSVAAERILSFGYAAKLTTKNNNIAMQKVAKAIGMTIDKN